MINQHFMRYKKKKPGKAAFIRYKCLIMPSMYSAFVAPVHGMHELLIQPFSLLYRIPITFKWVKLVRSQWLYYFLRRLSHALQVLCLVLLQVAFIVFLKLQSGRAWQIVTAHQLGKRKVIHKIYKADL